MLQYSSLHHLFTAISGFLLVLECGYQEGLNIPRFSRVYKNSRKPGRLEESRLNIDIMYIGVLIGSLISLFLLNKIGRKKTFTISVIPKIICWIIMSVEDSSILSPNMSMSRIHAGIGCGMMYVVIPIYLGEIIIRPMRAVFGILIAMFLNLGMLLAFYLEYYLPQYFSIAMIIVLPISHFYCYFSYPDSLKFLRRQHYSMMEQRCFFSIKKNDKKESDIERNNCSLKELFINLYYKGEARRKVGILMTMLIVINMMSTLPIFMCEKFMAYDNIYSIPPPLIISAYASNMTLIVIMFVLIQKKFQQNSLSPISSGLSFIPIVFAIENINLSIIGLTNKSLNHTLLVYVLLCRFGCEITLNCVPFAFIGDVFNFNFKVPLAIFSIFFTAFTRIIILRLYEVAQNDFGIPITFLYIIGITSVVGLLVRYWNR